MTGSEFDILPIIAAAQDLEGSLKDKILFQVTGFIIVLSVLSLLWAGIAIIGAVFGRFKFDLPEEASAKRSVQPPPVATPKPPLTPHHVAAITAALHTVIKGHYQIVDIEEETTKK